MRRPPVGPTNTRDAVRVLIWKGETAMTEPLYVSGAAGYDDVFAHVTGAFLPALVEAAQITAGHRVLDVATGTGAVAQAVAELVGPGGQVIAGDISTAMLDVARRKLKDTPIRFEHFDGQALLFPHGYFDRVVCQLGLAFFDDPATVGMYRDNLCRCQRTTGVLALEDATPLVVQRYLAGLQASGLRPASVHQHFVCLRAFLTCAPSLRGGDNSFGGLT